MGKKYVIGIDSGTQSTRVSIFSEKGDRVAIGASRHPEMLTPQPGWYEHGKGESWNALLDAAKKAFEEFGGSKDDIAGIGISSQRICVNIVDKNNDLIHNPISWMDSRWRMSIERIGALPDDIENFFYKYFLPYYSMANWMKFHKPEVYEKAAKYLNVSGYLGAKLTGEYRDSIANNVGWPYDEIKWEGYVEDRYIDLMGYRRDQLVDVVPPGGLIGRITAEASAQTGFPEGCPLYASAGDKQCELLGVGAVKHGQAYITLGTLSGMDVVCKDYKPSPTFGYQTYLAAYPKNYNFEAMLGKGFWLVSWFRDNFGMDLAAASLEKGVSIEELLEAEASTLPAGAEGLVFLPDWSPGPAHPYGKGMFIGFDDRHRRAHLYRSLIEGIVIEIKTRALEMLNALEIPLEEIYIGGGGSKSNFCAQAIADVFNVPVKRTKEPENCSLGTAMCAAVGCGIYPSLDAAIEGMARNYDTFAPNAENHALYEDLFNKVIVKLYSALEDIMKDLAELTAGGKQSG
jgi:sugar (pentulose or hexulose) kinase